LFLFIKINSKLFHFSLVLINISLMSQQAIHPQPAPQGNQQQPQSQNIPPPPPPPPEFENGRALF
jgi:hypothetical protein